MTCFLMSGLEGVEVDVLGVLRGEHDGVDADRAVVGVVLDGDLGLAVGAQVGQRAVLADRGELLGEALRDHDRQRHQLVGVVAGVAEHQALVAGALLVERVHGVRVRLSWPVSTPWAMSADWPPIATITPQEAPSKPFSEES